MELDKVTLFGVIKRRLAWLSQRQETIAQNIANADTPNYRARDLKPVKFKELLRRENVGLSMNVTQKAHLSGSGKQVKDFAEAEERRPYETSPNGNSVVLEEQMAKMSETQINHRLTNELYKKHLNMFRMALGRR